MRRRRSVLLLAVLFLAPGLLSGCFGGDDLSEASGSSSHPAGAASAETPRTDLKSASVVTIAGADLSLTPWLVDAGPVFRAASENEVIEVEHFDHDKGLVRLLTDGSAFHVLLDDDRVGTEEATDSILLLRVFETEGNTTVARAAVMLAADEPMPTIPLPVTEGLRLDVRYAFALHWFTVDGHQPIGTGLRAWSAEPLDYLVGAAIPEPGEGPFRLLADGLLSWETPVRFRAEAEMTFTGPESGIDRPSEFERPLWGGPDTGTYTITVNGTRMWQSLLFFDLDGSRVHATRPETETVGVTSLDVWLYGFRSLDDWRAAPRTKGLSQSFVFEMDVDYETAGGEVPADEVQEFYVRHIPAYRWSGQGWQSDEVFRSVLVDVKGELTP